MSYPRTVDGLTLYLLKQGYRYYKPAGKTWHSALVYVGPTAALCVLFRKNGIDLRHYQNHCDEITVKEGNRISMRGGDLYRNHYNESKVFVIPKIGSIATQFLLGNTLEDLFIESGRSYRHNPAFSRIKKKARRRYLLRYGKRGFRLPVDYDDSYDDDNEYRDGDFLPARGNEG